MGKKKANKNMRFSIDDKKAAKKLRTISGYMKEINSFIGKEGDGDTGAKTLIGGIEGLNHEYKDGTATTWYNNMNTKTLKSINTRFNEISKSLETLDQLISWS